MDLKSNCIMPKPGFGILPKKRFTCHKKMKLCPVVKLTVT